jgi:hypothetical protein
MVYLDNQNQSLHVYTWQYLLYWKFHITNCLLWLWPKSILILCVGLKLLYWSTCRYLVHLKIYNWNKTTQNIWIKLKFELWRFYAFVPKLPKYAKITNITYYVHFFPMFVHIEFSQVTWAIMLNTNYLLLDKLGLAKSLVTCVILYPYIRFFHSKNKIIIILDNQILFDHLWIF